jgi:hypothetical protein
MPSSNLDRTRLLARPARRSAPNPHTARRWHNRSPPGDITRPGNFARRTVGAAPASTRRLGRRDPIRVTFRLSLYHVQHCRQIRLLHGQGPQSGPPSARRRPVDPSQRRAPGDATPIDGLHGTSRRSQIRAAPHGPTATRPSSRTPPPRPARTAPAPRIFAVNRRSCLTPHWRGPATRAACRPSSCFEQTQRLPDADPWDCVVLAT